MAQKDVIIRNLGPIIDEIKAFLQEHSPGLELLVGILLGALKVSAAAAGCGFALLAFTALCLHGKDLCQLRQEVSRPIAKQLHAYLLSIRPQLLPKSEACQAVAYLLKNWLALTRYLEEGDLSIDNNRTERSLRGIAVGRRKWTFLGSDCGGKTMAILRSFVSSCELSKIDPFAWFRDVLARIPSHSLQKLDLLLPHHWTAQAN